MLKNVLEKYEELLDKALVDWNNVKEGKTENGVEPLEYYNGEISAYRKIIQDLKDSCPNVNLMYSNPTIKWLKKQFDTAGVVFIHTNIRPDLTKLEGYEWGTCRMDRKEFERRVNIVNQLIKEANIGFEPLDDEDLLEELF